MYSKNALGYARRKKNSGGKKMSLSSNNNKPFGPIWTGSFMPNVGFPDRLKIRLKYVQEAQMSSSPNPSGVVMALNGLYDPYISGSGHQPNYYDQLTALYGRYCVTGSQAVVELNNVATVAANCVAAYSDNSITTYTVENISETKYAKTRSLGQTSGAPSVQVIQMPWISTKQLQGQKEIESDDAMYASTGANPTDATLLTVKVSSVDGSTNANTWVRIILLYDCVFKDLIFQTESLSTLQLKHRERLAARGDLAYPESQDCEPRPPSPSLEEKLNALYDKVVKGGPTSS
jgi:hypothetical protein